MNERIGVLAAVVSRALGGMAAAATRFVAGAIDPVTIAGFRFGGGFLHLGIFGGAAAFYLWVFALERTTPTRVANTMTVNPLAASIVAAIILDEPIGLNLIVGLAAVFAGILIASTESSPT